MSHFEEMFGENLQGKDGGLVKTSTAVGTADQQAVGIYFSAHWCPPCRGFTPQLAELYKNELKAKGLEIVFVSSDRDDASFQEYYKEMPWLALPFDAKDKKEALSKKYGVQGIPTLVIVDAKTGELITKDGRAVCRDVNNFPWKA